MTNLQKMFNGDLAAADKWVVNTSKDTLCDRCKLHAFCNLLKATNYPTGVICELTHLRWLLEDAEEEPAYTELRVSMRPVRVRMMCQCGGEFEPTDTSSGSTIYTDDSNAEWKVLYQHKCRKCGAVQAFDRIYPYIKYEGVEANDELRSNQK